MLSINKNPKLMLWSSLIGNSLDHYDSALYIFLAPIIAPLFFPNQDPATALILTYGIKLSSIITRPLGSIVFGHLARKYPVKMLLYITLIGVTISTTAIGLLPVYSSIGILSPVLLSLLKSLQGFFAAGEHNISSLFILDQVKNTKKHGKTSSYYLFSTMTGSLLASIAAWLVSEFSNSDMAWRIPFLFGIITGVFGLIIRQSITIQTSPPDKNYKVSDSINVLNKNKWNLLKIIPISSFTFITYTIPFTFFNSFFSIPSNIYNVTLQEILRYSPILIAVNNLLIPLFANIIDRFNIFKWMASFSAIFSVSIIPIFILVPYLNIHGINIVKLWIIIIGVAFVAPLNSLMFKLVPNNEKYLVSGVGYSLGTELLGKKTNLICLLLWEYTGSLLVPAIYLSSISALTTIVLILEYIKSKNAVS